MAPGSPHLPKEILGSRRPLVTMEPNCRSGSRCGVAPPGEIADNKPLMKRSATRLCASRAEGIGRNGIDAIREAAGQGFDERGTCRYYLLRTTLLTRPRRTGRIGPYFVRTSPIDRVVPAIRRRPFPSALVPVSLARSNSRHAHSSPSQTMMNSPVRHRSSSRRFVKFLDSVSAGTASGDEDAITLCCNRHDSPPSARR